MNFSGSGATEAPQILIELPLLEKAVRESSGFISRSDDQHGLSTDLRSLSYAHRGGHLLR